ARLDSGAVRRPVSTTSMGRKLPDSPTGRFNQNKSSRFRLHAGNVIPRPCVDLRAWIAAQRVGCQRNADVTQASRLAAGRMIREQVSRADVLHHLLEGQAGMIGAHRFAAGRLSQMKYVRWGEIGIDVNSGLRMTRPYTAPDHDGVQSRVNSIQRADHIVVV